MENKLSKLLGKKIEFTVSGDSVSLDRAKLELLHDAMIHLVRNSIDHGIEDPEKRLEIHKPEIAQINLNIESQEHGFEITLIDDGKGIDPQEIYQLALNKRAIAPESILSDKEKQMLIFTPNLSSKSDISEVSGRGVGMDVVKSNLEQLGASIEMESVVGKGTKFTINYIKSR